MTATLNLSAANNATWTVASVPLLDDASAPLAMPDGVKVRMQLRATADSQDVALELSLENSRLTFVSRDAATIKIEVPASAMKDVGANTYPYDIIVEYPTARVLRPVEGTANIVQGVTR